MTVAVTVAVQQLCLRGLGQTRAGARTPIAPRAAPAELLPCSPRLSCALRPPGKATASRISSVCLSMWWSQKREQTHAASHRGHADPSVQSLWKGCRGKPVLLVRARRPPCPALKWSTTLGFSIRLCATSGVLPSQRGADLCTDTGKAVEEDSWYGARQPPACSKSHTG